MDFFVEREILLNKKNYRNGHFVLFTGILHQPMRKFLNAEIFLPLSIYRLKFLAIEVYKCINNLNSTYLSDLFVHKNVNYELRDRHKLEQPKLNTKKYGYRYFMYYGSKLWNLLPNDVKRSTSIWISWQNRGMALHPITKWLWYILDALF